MRHDSTSCLGEKNLIHSINQQLSKPRRSSNLFTWNYLTKNKKIIIYVTSITAIPNTARHSWSNLSWQRERVVIFHNPCPCFQLERVIMTRAFAPAAAGKSWHLCDLNSTNMPIKVWARYYRVRISHRPPSPPKGERRRVLQHHSA